MRINTNIASILGQNYLRSSRNGVSQAMERLSSGLRINQAADDAAGLAIANRMESRIRGKDQALRNVLDGQSLLQTLDSGLDAINDNVQRIRELAVRMANGTNSASDRASLQAEIDARLAEIDRISHSLAFNGMSLGQASGINLQVGENAADTLAVQLQDIGVQALGLGVQSFSNVGPPLDSVTIVNGTDPGTYEITDATFNVAIYDETQKETLRIQGIDAVAQYYGVSPDDISFRKRLDGGANSYVIQIGDNYYPASLSNTRQGHAWINDDNSISYLVRFGYSWAYVVDPETGESQRVALDSAKLGTLEDGTIVNYYEYGGKAFLGKVKTGDPDYVPGYAGTFILEGENSEAVTLMAPDYITDSDTAISRLNEYRAYIGATMNRLDSIANGLASDKIALQMAQSRIQDADYAAEISALTRNQILQQAGHAVLAQANNMNRDILMLLQ